MTTFGCCSFLTKCDTKKYGKKGVLSYITLSIKSFPYLKKTHGPLILPFGLQIRPCNCSPHPHGAAGLVSWSGLEVPGGGWDCTRVSGRGVRLQDTLGSMLAAAHFHIHRLFIGHPRPTTSQDRVGILPNPGNLASRGKTNKSYVTSSHFSTILCSIWAKKGFDQKKKTQKKSMFHVLEPPFWVKERRKRVSAKH